MLSYAISKEQNSTVKAAYTTKEQNFSELLAKAKATYYEKLWIGNKIHSVQASTKLTIHIFIMAKVIQSEEKQEI